MNWYFRPALRRNQLFSHYTVSEWQENYSVDLHCPFLAKLDSKLFRAIEIDVTLSNVKNSLNTYSLYAQVPVLSGSLESQQNSQSSSMPHRSLLLNKYLLLQNAITKQQWQAISGDQDLDDAVSPYQYTNDILKVALVDEVLDAIADEMLK